MGTSGRVGKLRWLSRRGMKELDILLDGFIQQEAEALAQGAWPEFETLLATEDDVLWDWMQNPAAVESANLRALVQEIRDPGGTA